MQNLCLILAVVAFLLLALASLTAFGHLWVILGIAGALFAFGHLPIQ